MKCFPQQKYTMVRGRCVRMSSLTSWSRAVLITPAASSGFDRKLDFSSWPHREVLTKSLSVANNKWQCHKIPFPASSLRSIPDACGFGELMAFTKDDSSIIRHHLPTCFFKPVTYFIGILSRHSDPHWKVSSFVASPGDRCRSDFGSLSANQICSKTNRY